MECTLIFFGQCLLLGLNLKQPKLGCILQPCAGLNTENPYKPIPASLYLNASY